MSNTAATTYALQIKNLVKTYKGRRGEEIHALKGVNLNIKKGEFFGLLGPNGAGKSTLIGSIATTVKKTSGQITINGYNLDTQSNLAKRSIGIVPQELYFDPFFSPVKTLLLRQGLYGITPNKDKCMALLQSLQLHGRENAPMRSLSGGMKRRVLMACAMIHDPDIIILDEPTAGVDVDLRHTIWDNLRRLKEAGTTIILTTHYLEEAEELCERVAIINKGEVILTENTQELIGKFGSHSMSVTLDNPHIKLPPTISEYFTHVNHSKVVFSFNDTMVSGLIIQELTKAGVQIHSVQMTHSSLEDVFVKLVHSSNVSVAH